MNIQGVYQKFLDRINSLSSNHGQHIGGLRQFVDCFNEAQYSLMSEAIQSDEATDDLQELLLPFLVSKPLQGLNKDKYYSFKLPDDYEHFKDIWVTGKSDTCHKNLTVQLRRAGEASRLYEDSMYEPSIEWEETFATLAKDEIRVYVKGFSVTAKLDYYKAPRQVSLAGYTLNGVATTDIDPEFEGRQLERVIDRAAKIHLRNVNDARTNSFR